MIEILHENSKLLPSGKRLHNYGKSPSLLGKSTISMAIFNSFLYVYQWLNGLNLLKSQFLAGLIPNPLDVGPAQAWPFAATAACRLAGCLLPGTRGTWQYDHGNWRNVIH